MGAGLITMGRTATTRGAGITTATRAGGATTTTLCTGRLTSTTCALASLASTPKIIVSRINNFFIIKYLVFHHMT